MAVLIVVHVLMLVGVVYLMRWYQRKRNVQPMRMRTSETYSSSPILRADFAQVR